MANWDKFSYICKFNQSNRHLKEGQIREALNSFSNKPAQNILMTFNFNYSLYFFFTSIPAHFQNVSINLFDLSEVNICFFGIRVIWWNHLWCLKGNASRLLVFATHNDRKRVSRYKCLVIFRKLLSTIQNLCRKHISESGIRAETTVLLFYNSTDQKTTTKSSSYK